MRGDVAADPSPRIPEGARGTGPSPPPATAVTEGRDAGGGSRSVEPTRFVVVANLKGGVGKTTLAVNLACALAVVAGHATALVDADPQRSATLWAARRRLPVEVLAIPSEVGDGSVHNWMWAVRRVRGRRARVVVDLPAVLGELTGAALLFADLVVVPTTLDAIDVEATRRTLRLVRRTRLQREDRGPHALVVPNRVEGGFLEVRRALARLRDLGEDMAPPVRRHALFPGGFTGADWVGGMRRFSRATRDIRRLLERVEARLAMLPESLRLHPGG